MKKGENEVLLWIESLEKEIKALREELGLIREDMKEILGAVSEVHVLFEAYIKRVLADFSLSSD